MHKKNRRRRSPRRRLYRFTKAAELSTTPTFFRSRSVYRTLRPQSPLLAYLCGIVLLIGLKNTTTAVVHPAAGRRSQSQESVCGPPFFLMASRRQEAKADVLRQRERERRRDFWSTAKHQGDAVLRFLGRRQGCQPEATLHYFCLSAFGNPASVAPF